ncbi:hypothetical protein TTHERM_00395770 (macronuclear) [Tetrahymena thermophila SB210]|uniref:Uncharacterized protein n=1 Tax=Tetrahymena thermophila (strain SB210) TaxID=312017 RepID=Q232X6_TETTS|nr:hypothetical protein TTHERM_00395770 [Tetrahymena thermophila SB210]EAR91704.2 hypothetical protein TTHERM_00395770 [Tetrahymena thermophila SB210]|eukprot:XP_001011949.2 hypothetical protein TTHERM_00395770 [Tetrahymena thermophila SB210]
MEIENDNDSIQQTSEVVTNSDSSSQSVNSNKETNQINFQFVVLKENDDDKEKVIKKLKKEQMRKRKIQNKLEKVKKQNKLLGVKQSDYTIQPFFQILQPMEDCFVFGEIVLEGDYYRDPFNIEKTYQWSYWKRGEYASQVKEICCTQVDMKRMVSTEFDFQYAIQKYLNMPDQLIHQLGLYLQEYYEKAKKHLSLMKERINVLRDLKVKEQFQMISQDYFKRGLEWVKTQVTKDDIYMYIYYEIDFETLDQNYKNIGYSQTLLNLLGLNEENAIPFILRKGRLEFLDGLSRLRRLIGRLYYINRKKPNHGFYFEHDIMTLDNIKIPVKCVITTPDFQCFTPENFQHYDLFFGEFALEYSCFRVFKFEINPNIIENIKQQRALNEKNYQIDFEYSLMSEMFIDKFYKNQDDEIQKKIIQQKAEDEQNKSRTCGIRYI